MHLLMSFFNCLPLRRLIFSNNAERGDHEHDAIHQQGLSDGYHPEPAPCSHMRSPRRSRRFSTRESRTPHRKGGKPSTYPSERRFFECSTRRLSRANRSALKDYAGYEYPARTVALSLTDKDMDVIEALFHFRGARRGAKETKWSEFLRLMERLQFKESRGAGNSSRFSPLGPSEIFPVESLGEVITEHRPHNGRNTLSLREMRDIGCRMNHAFGWTADTFRNIWER